MWHALLLSWGNGFWSSCSVTARSWWLLTPESLGFPLSSLFPNFICFWWTKPNSAISELLTCILLSPVPLLDLLLLLQSHHWEFIFLKYFLSLTSLTVWVTYRLSEDQYLCNTCTQPIELALPLSQCASLLPARGPLGPLWGAPLVASPLGFCRSLGAQMLCFISCSLYCKSQLYFCVFQIEMCTWRLSMFFQTPTIPLRESLLCWFLCHPPALLVPPSVLLPLLPLSVIFLPPLVACCTTHMYRMDLEGRHWGRNIKPRNGGCANGPDKCTGLTASGL